MEFYKYSEEDVYNKNLFDLVEKLDERTSEEIKFIVNELVSSILFDIKDCESPIERLLGVAISNCSNNINSICENRFDMYPQWEIICGKKIYRVDFFICCIYKEKEKTIVIECDGHDFHEKTKEQVMKDKKRDRDLIMNGYTVLHFSGSEIFKNPYACVNDIISVIKSE